MERKFGDEYKIANAYITRALKWLIIKADDFEGLDCFAVSLRDCNNAMKEINYL